MKISPEKLPEQLRGSLPAVVLVEGEETLLRIESTDRIRAAATAAGYEREVLDAGPVFDWGRLAQARSGMSLFATTTLVELRLAKGKLDARAEAALNHYLDDPSPEKCLLVSAPKLDKGQNNKAWYKRIASDGWVVSCPKIYADKFGKWLAGEVRNQGLGLTREGFDALLLRVEGNPLAARQEIQKLFLFFDGQPLSDADVARITAESARYTVFDLSEAALNGQVDKVSRILATLESEGADAFGVLRLIARDVALLADIKSHPGGLRAGVAAIQTYPMQRDRLAGAAKRLSDNAVLALSQQALRVDRSIKGQNTTPAWLSLSQLALKIAGARTPAS